MGGVKSVNFDTRVRFFATRVCFCAKYLFPATAAAGKPSIILQKYFKGVSVIRICNLWTLIDFECTLPLITTQHTGQTWSQGGLVRNKKSKSASTKIRVAVCILGEWDYSQMVDSNILRGEQNLWDIGNQRYQAMEKVTLSGTFKTQPRPEEEREVREY